MRAHLNSITWFVAGTFVGLLAAGLLFGIAGRGWDAMGVVVFSLINLPVGATAFIVVTRFASRITGETHRYWLSLTTGLLYPASLYGLGTWFDSGMPIQLSLPATIACLFVVSLVCECILFGAGGLVGLLGALTFNIQHQQAGA